MLLCPMLLTCSGAGDTGREASLPALRSQVAGGVKRVLGQLGLPILLGLLSPFRGFLGYADGDGAVGGGGEL